MTEINPERVCEGCDEWKEPDVELQTVEMEYGGKETLCPDCIRESYDLITGRVDPDPKPEPILWINAVEVPYEDLPEVLEDIKEAVDDKYTVLIASESIELIDRQELLDALGADDQ